MKIKTQVVKITRFICPRCNIFLGKDLDKIPDLCVRCKTELEKWNFTMPDPYLTHFQ